MKIFNGYILVSEITAKANKSAAWLYETKSAQIEYMGGTPVVKISSLSEKYQELAKQCQDMKTYYPYADFSREIGRTKDFIGVLADQRKQKNVLEARVAKNLADATKPFMDEVSTIVNKQSTMMGLTPVSSGRVPTYDPSTGTFK